MDENTSQEIEISYKRIKDQIIQISFSDKDVKSLILGCSKVINSKRKQSTISNIKDLMAVLEERCALGCFDIEPLFIIEEKAGAGSEVLKTMISCHQKLLVRSNSNRDIIDEPLVKESCPNLRVEIPKPVVKLISQGIGDSWRDFARCLKIREYDIDNIERNYYEDSDRVKKALVLFEETASYFTYKDVILSSLLKIGRTALMESVDRMFSHVLH